MGEGENTAFRCSRQGRKTKTQPQLLEDGVLRGYVLPCAPFLLPFPVRHFQLPNQPTWAEHSVEGSEAKRKETHETRGAAALPFPSTRSPESTALG